MAAVQIEEIEPLIKPRSKEEVANALRGLLVEDESLNDHGEREVEIDTTEYGPLKVFIQGSITEKPVIMTYHDIGTNHVTCFHRFLNYAKRADKIFGQFSYVHIDAPGQTYGSEEVETKSAWLDFEVLAEQIETVRKTLGIKRFVAFGVGAGAYLMSRYASLHPDNVTAMVCVAPTCRKCGWIEWVTKWNSLLSKWYMKDDHKWKDWFMARWFSETTRQDNVDLIEAHMRSLDRFNEQNLYKFVQGFQRRVDIGNDLGLIKNQCVLFVGDLTDLETECVKVMHNMGDANVEWIRVQLSGALITEEDPHSIVEPFRLLLNGLGFFGGRKPEADQELFNEGI